MGKLSIFKGVKVYVVLVLMSFGVLYGQDNKLISRYKPGIMWYYNGARPLEDSKLKKFDRFIVDVAYNDWLCNYRYLLSKSWRSIGCNINIMFEERSKKNANHSFGYGLRYTYSNIRTDYNLTQGHGSVFVNQRANSDTYGVNLLREHSIVVPLEYRFGKPLPRAFKINVGAFVGYGFPIRQVIKYDGSKEVSKITGTSGIKYGVHARIGGRALAGFFSVQLGQLFKKSVPVYPIQLGISYSLF